MRNYITRYGIIALVLVCLGLTGCLVSGTFAIVEGIEFNFTADTGFYWYPIDLSENDDWEEHKDKLDDIEAIGFDFLIQNTSDQTCTFSVMFRSTSGMANTLNPPAGYDNPANYIVVLDEITVAAGATRHVTYAETLSLIKNQAALKAIIMKERFDYYGVSCGGTDNDLFLVTEGKIIITVAASDS